MHYGSYLIMHYGLSISCDTDKISETVNSKNTPETKTSTLQFKYHYRGVVYNEVQWRQTPNNKKAFSIIGLNDNLYVFDNQNEAKFFENRNFKEIFNQKEVSLKTRYPIKNNAKGDTFVAKSYVSYSINLFPDTNYRGTVYQKLYNLAVIEWWRTSLGRLYLKGDVNQFDLPETIRKKTSSFKLNYSKGGTAYTNYGNEITTRKLVCTIYLRAGKLSDTSTLSFNSTLTNDPYNNFSSTRDISNLAEYRMWGLLGLTTWNDQIQSVKVEFD